MERENNMRKLVVSEWVTLDGVFDADTMKEWFEPYDSDGRRNCIRETVLASDAFLVGRVTYEMLAAYWPNQKNNKMGIADRLNSAPKYVVSSTLKKAEWNNSTIIEKNVVDLKERFVSRPVPVLGYIRRGAFDWSSVLSDLKKYFQKPNAQDHTAHKHLFDDARSAGL